MDNTHTQKEMLNLLWESVDILRKRVDAMWTRLVGINGDGLISKLDTFFSNDIHQLVKKSECEAVRSAINEHKKTFGERIRGWALVLMGLSGWVTALVILLRG
jgi:hypothetical protein